MISRPIVVFDFDGTLALGRGPLQAYVACLADVAGDETAQVCLDAVAAFGDGGTDYRDAYDAVRQAALARGVTDPQLSAAYLASRDLLGTDAGPVTAPAGLAEFLADLATTATCVLATNAPETGVERALASLGASAHITERHHAIGKPAGLTPIIAAHLRAGPVLAVGDIWEYDLAPAAELGADTALVGVSTPAGATPTLRGATLTDLYDDIRTWATSHATARTTH